MPARKTTGRNTEARSDHGEVLKTAGSFLHIRAMPGWKANLAGFGFVIMLVMGYFYSQAQQAQEEFRQRIEAHSRMLAGIISFSLTNSLSSQKAVEETIYIFLESSAKFIDYLEIVEPFSPPELSAFASEAGLAGISILRDNGPDTSGPADWQPEAVCLPTPSSLLYYPEEKIYLFMLPKSSEAGCVMVGFDASGPQKLMQEIGVDRLLEDLRNLPLINYVRFAEPVPGDFDRNRIDVVLIRQQDNNVAESRLFFNDRILVVGIDANRYIRHMKRLWRELFLFSCILAVLGILISWLLHRHQSSLLITAREMERQLAKQHEDAVLGRAAATISHEIKNPLNAISMGLQRIGLEMAGISAEHEKLLHSMMQAVSRTNRIVGDLKQYTQPVALRRQLIILHEIIDDVLVLYREECLERGIVIDYKCRFAGSLAGDPDLLGQAFENMLKNAIEAQPRGGQIKITLGRSGNHCLLITENKGFTLNPQELNTILEPYFSSKVQGTGLGMAIAKRIIEAHDGQISLELAGAGILRVIVTLPCSAGEQEG